MRYSDYTLWFSAFQSSLLISFKLLQYCSILSRHMEIIFFKLFGVFHKTLICLWMGKWARKVFQWKRRIQFTRFQKSLHLQSSKLGECGLKMDTPLRKLLYIFVPLCSLLSLSFYICSAVFYCLLSWKSVCYLSGYGSISYLFFFPTELPWEIRPNQRRNCLQLSSRGFPRRLSRWLAQILCWGWVNIWHVRMYTRCS